MKPETIVSVDNLAVQFKIHSGLFGKSAAVRAVDGVSFDVRRGEVLGLVGESGCGKSSLGRAILRLIEPHSGKILFDDADFLKLSGNALRTFRCRAQMVFQDPYASLDPRMTIYDTLAEPLRQHQRHSKKELEGHILEILRVVGLNKTALKKYPHEFSGGQRQRVAIARALILKPELIVADEPVSSLDVSIQAQILNLIKDIQKELGLSMLFISHNLAVVRYISNRIAVMYLGRIVEIAEARQLYENPRHPYTQALLSAVPIPDPAIERSRKRIALSGEIPSPKSPPSGCRFHTRCWKATARCRVESPALKPVGTSGQWQVACFEADRS